jgi:hypothetical protein
MSESTMPKLIILDLKGQKFIHVQSPTTKTIRQARKYWKKKKKTKTQNPQHNSNHQSKEMRRLLAARTKTAMERCGGDRQHSGDGKVES